MRPDLGIVQHPSPVLRRVSRRVGGPDRAVLALAAAMAGIMEEAGGLGLAAIQVGVPLRLFVARLPGLPAGLPPVLIDPEIAWASPETRPSPEGCLSIPGGRVVIERHREVHVAFLGADGAPARLALSGLQAAIAQHEIDHLDGRLVIDRPAIPRPAA